jgi:uncharacterized membrane protein
MKSAETSWRPGAAWWTVAILSWLVMAYASMYLILRERIFPPDLADSFRSRPWGIYPHVIVGMLGLALGPLQFHPRIQLRRSLHRKIGIVYVCDALIVGAVGLYMACYSLGGMVTHVGFALLAIGVLITTAAAFKQAKAGNYAQHREWMIRSYALLFGAVTLRVWLPILIAMNAGDFRAAYLWVAWVSWVPNVFVAEWYIRSRRTRGIYFAGAPLAERPASLSR